MRHPQKEDASALEAAEYWENFAREEDQRGDWERDHGRNEVVYRNRAKTYRDAAKALRIEADTGVPHCSCCFKPLGGKR